MAVLSEVVVERFADLCHLADRSWSTWRALHDGAPQLGDFSKGMSRDAATAYAHVLQACQEHAVLQIAKLHDRTAINDNITLGLNYILRYGGWEPAVRDQLNALKTELDELSKPLRESLRNKLLAHNDLAAVVTGGTIVIFAQGQDSRYFERLWEFLNIVYGQVKRAGFARSEQPSACGEALAKWLSRER